MAFTGSSLGMKLENGELPGWAFLNADAAYQSKKWMVTPSRSAADDDFNYYQSAVRMPIEQCFGVIVRRWGILWRPLEMAFDKRAAVLGCCVRCVPFMPRSHVVNISLNNRISLILRLHNWCVDRRLELNLQMRADGHALVQPDDHGRGWVQMPVFDKHGTPVRYLDTEAQNRGGADSMEGNGRRKSLIEKMRNSGLKRHKRSKNSST